MNRTPFIDRIRVALTALVVFHHTAITYGAIGGWYWAEVENRPDLSLSSKILTLFCAVNQAYFMGFFFLLAGYFTPPAYDKKGPRQFLTERFLRLGIPLLIYSFFLHPPTIALARLADGRPLSESLSLLYSDRDFSQGPLWFAQALLIFAAAYVVWRLAAKKSEGGAARSVAPPSNVFLFLSALGVGVSAFLIRLWVPTGENVFGMQLGYFASYVFLFAAGCAAWRGRLLEKVKWRQAWPWAAWSLLLIPVLPVALAVGGADGFSGGWSGKAALYAFWEPFMAWGWILGLLWAFRRYGNRPSEAWSWLAERSYGVYIVHPPILVGVTVALRHWAAPPLVKFPVSGALTCLGCLIVADLLLRIPGARRIL